MAAFQVTLTNEKTGETVLLKSNDRQTLENKIYRKQQTWRKQNARLEQREEKELAIQRAQENTQQAVEEIDQYKQILDQTLKINDVIDWSDLEDHKEFKPYSEITKPDWATFEATIPSKNFLEFINHFKQKRLSAEKNARQNYDKAVKLWEAESKKSKQEYEKAKKAYTDEQAAHNKKIDQMRKGYEKGDKASVEEYINLVLEKSEYPESLDLYSVVQFSPETKTLIVSMDLPSISKIPSIKEYKYVASRKETTTVEMGKNEFEAFYNDVIYQITLRTIHEIFESDYSSQVSAVVFNGWIDGTDTRTGRDFKNCIVSIQVIREEFLEINLDKIAPQDCFRHLKGVSAGSLVNLAPVKPIMTLREEDDRELSAQMQ